ncbi:unnamed protein product [Somion occarium]|uniref:Secreted protein n=1 Tax=Somion occarium TaxID=3059160 RepID=A0ABP1D827_9APHY
MTPFLLPFFIVIYAAVQLVRPPCSSMSLARPAQEHRHVIPTIFLCFINYSHVQNPAFSHGPAISHAVSNNWYADLIQSTSPQVPN